MITWLDLGRSNSNMVIYMWLLYIFYKHYPIFINTIQKINTENRVLDHLLYTIGLAMYVTYMPVCEQSMVAEWEREIFELWCVHTMIGMLKSCSRDAAQMVDVNN